MLQLLTNSRLSAPSMRHHLLMVLRDEPDLTFAHFEAFYKEVMEVVCNASLLSRNPGRDRLEIQIRKLNKASRFLIGSYGFANTIEN